MARGVTGQEPAQPASRPRRLLGNLLTVALILVALALLLRRFGVIRH